MWQSFVGLAAGAVIAIATFGVVAADGWSGGPALTAATERPSIALSSAPVPTQPLMPNADYSPLERFCVSNQGAAPVAVRLRMTDVNDPSGLARHLRWRLDAADGERANLVRDVRLEELAAGTDLTGGSGATSPAPLGSEGRCYELAVRLDGGAPNAAQGATFSYRLSVSAQPWPTVEP